MSEDRHSNVLQPFGGAEALLGAYHGPVSQAELCQAALPNVTRALGAQKFLCFSSSLLLSKKRHTCSLHPSLVLDQGRVGVWQRLKQP